VRSSRCGYPAKAERNDASDGKNGWCDALIAKEELQWLRRVRPDGDLLLVWDLFAGHREGQVRALPQQLGIAMLFIPFEMTDKLQPLDWRLFGNLKQRARARWTNGLPEHGEQNRILQFVLKASLAVKKDGILEAWDVLKPSSDRISEHGE
jgi:hypothetical protein